MIGRRLRKDYGHLLGLPRVSEKIRKLVPIVGRDAVARRLARREPREHYLTLTAITLNEGAYLREWIEFHRLVGVDHFLIYDNDSTDDTREVLAPYVQAGLVELLPWPNFLAGANAQHLAYAHASVCMTGRTHWMMPLDIDEFFFSPSADEVTSVLREYEDLPALGVFRRCFGPDGHEKRPEGLQIESFLKRLDDEAFESREYKSALRPELVRSIIGAHRFHHTVDDTHGRDEQRRVLTQNVGLDHSSERLRINHYATRSAEEMRNKVARRYFGSDRTVELRREQKIARHSKLFECSIEDRDILRFVPALRERLQHPPAP